MNALPCVYAHRARGGPPVACNLLGRLNDFHGESVELTKQVADKPPLPSPPLPPPCHRCIRQRPEGQFPQSYCNISLVLSCLSCLRPVPRNPTPPVLCHTGVIDSGLTVIPTELLQSIKRSLLISPIDGE